MTEPNSEAPTVGSTHMRPRARLISLLGDELVSDERVAVVELVKNAYDADASKVTVSFNGPNPARPDVLTITDDGTGMSLDRVLHGWLEPGTVAKKSSNRTITGRALQGAKGVGRFASARLAPKLLLETKTAGSILGVRVALEWGRFDDASYLDEVIVDYAVTQVDGFDHGTRLTLTGLNTRKEWTSPDFDALHDRLSRLLSPFDEVHDFSIVLDVPARPDLAGKVTAHAITNQPRYRLRAHLTAGGLLSGAIEVGGEQHRVFESHQLGAKGEIVDCGPLELEFRCWDRDRAGLANFMIEYQLGLRQVRSLLDTYCGVSIYRDGFRVHPYGEPGDDWLKLDNRSRQSPTTRLANNQLIAFVRIGRETNPGLVDRTTREGLVHNRDFDALREWTVRALALLEEERYKLRPREEVVSEDTRTIFEAFDLAEVVAETDRQLGVKHPIAQLVRKSDVEIREGVVRLQEHYSRLLLTAGVGQIVDLVIHEMGGPLGRANRELTHLEKLLDRVLAADDRKEIDRSLADVRTWLEQLVSLRSRLDPRGAGKRGRSTSFNVIDEVQGNLMLFESLITKQGINVTTVAPKSGGVVVNMARGALSQVIANLLDNAIHWLTRHHGDGKGGRIEVSIRTLPHGFSVLVSDDGPGIPLSDQERIFDPYYTTKPNGMGLGLYIARQVMERYGRLVLKSDGPLSGASFEAEFSQHVGL